MKLFNKLLYSSRISQEWKTIETIPLLKIWEDDPADYRGITLPSRTEKVLGKIIQDKLQLYLQLSKEQQGFHSKRSATDVILLYVSSRKSNEIQHANLCGPSKCLWLGEVIWYNMTIDWKKDNNPQIR